MQCPKCKKEIEEVTLEFVAQQIAYLDEEGKNRIVAYDTPENTGTCEIKAYCPKCEADIAHALDFSNEGGKGMRETMTSDWCESCKNCPMKDKLQDVCYAGKPYYQCPAYQEDAPHLCNTLRGKK